jgi:hypothetical protein
MWFLDSGAGLSPMLYYRYGACGVPLIASLINTSVWSFPLRTSLDCHLSLTISCSWYWSSDKARSFFITICDRIMRYAFQLFIIVFLRRSWCSRFSSSVILFNRYRCFRRSSLLCISISCSFKWWVVWTFSSGLTSSSLFRSILCFFSFPYHESTFLLNILNLNTDVSYLVRVWSHICLLHLSWLSCM